MKFGLVFPLLMLAAAPLDVHAEDAQSSAAACDVAVWTTANYQADRLGLVTGGMIDEMLKGKNVPEINSVGAIRSMLPPETLFDVLSHSRLNEIIGRPVNYIHIDKPMKEAEADRKSKTRAHASVNPCYIEVDTPIYPELATRRG